MTDDADNHVNHFLSFYLKFFPSQKAFHKFNFFIVLDAIIFKMADKIRAKDTKMFYKLKIR